MLLTIDVGNTNTVLGVFRGEELIANWRLTTARAQTVDEYGVLTRNLFSYAGLNQEDITGVMISSVVPPVNWTLAEMSRIYLAKKALFVEPGVKTGMAVLVDNPMEVGADRIVNGVAAFHQYGGPCIVIDFGTAITFDVISAKCEYLGGVIAPGIGIASEALFSRAARLPRVEIKDPGKVIGTNTVTHMQAGLYYGAVDMVDGMLTRIKAELKNEATVVATGGQARLVAKGIVFYQQRVVAARDVFPLALFKYIAQHPQRLVRLAVQRVAIHKWSQPPRRCPPVALYVVIVGDAELAFRQYLLHFAQPLLRLWLQWVFRVLLNERLELFLGHLCVGVVAIGLGHFIVIGHRHLHLRVSRFGQEREEHDEVLIARHRLRGVCGPAFLEIGIRNRQLGLRQVLAVRVGVDQRLQAQTAHLVAPVLDVVDGLVVELFVRFRRIRRIRRLIGRFLFVQKLGIALAGGHQHKRTHEKKR